MKTAIYETIEKIKECNDNFPKDVFDKEYVRGLDKGFQLALFILKEVGIAKEKIYLKDAFTSGNWDTSGIQDDDQLSEKYYNETFSHNAE